MEEIIIRLDPWPFVYHILLLHKEVFPQIVGLCILVLLIVEIFVYCLVIAHLLVVSSQPLHDDAGDVYLPFTVSGRPFGMLKNISSDGMMSLSVIGLIFLAGTPATIVFSGTS